MIAEASVCLSCFVASADLAMSHDGSLLVSIAEDKSIKIFDVPNIDMMAMLRLSYLPSCAAWIFKASPQALQSADSDLTSCSMRACSFRSYHQRHRTPSSQFLGFHQPNPLNVD